jgi:hypothetical protein
MKRIATRLVSFAALGLLTFGLASACASEQSAFPATTGDASANGAGGGGVGPGAGGAGATTCPTTPSFCPASATGMGVACCLGSDCGIDYGLGCVSGPAPGHTDAG